MVWPHRSTRDASNGGGSLPGETLPTALLSLHVPHPDAFAAQLRAANPPIIARIAADHLLFDPRTVLPGQEQSMIDVLKRFVNINGGTNS